MTLPENTPVSGETNGGEGLPVTTDITDTNDTSFDFDAEIGGMKSAQDAMREALKTWNERAQGYRVAKDVNAALPRAAFKHHPALADLKTLISVTWVGATDEDLSDYTIGILASVSKADDGTILFSGMGRDGVKTLMDIAARSRRIASERGDNMEAALNDQRHEIFKLLDVLFWETFKVPELPVAIGIREAVY